MLLTIFGQCAKRYIYSSPHYLSINTKTIKSYLSTVPSHPSMNVFPSGWNVKPINENDYDRSLNFLKKNFFCKELLNRSVGLQEDCKDLESFCIGIFPEPYSRILVDNNDDIISISLNVVRHKTDKIIDLSEKCEDLKFKKIVKFLYKTQKEANMFELYPHIDRYLSGTIIATKSDERFLSKGTATKLINHASMQAALDGISLLRGEATSRISARMMEKMGSTKIYSIFYKDYKINGEIVFKNIDPSEKFTIYALGTSKQNDTTETKNQFT